MTVTIPASVIVVGRGFAGLAAARSLARAPVQVVLVDRRNHHVFQPLLYQVATAALSPADIVAPIRTILRRQSNCHVALAEVTGIDVAARRLLLDEASAPYDYLVLPAGATHSYFGHDEWAAVAPGLKGIEDAIELRRRILLAFEAAEQEGSEAARHVILTFGVLGAGPTGAELAGAIKEIAGLTLPQDYRNIDTRTTRVILFEYGDRVLPQFPPDLSARARRDLEEMGVEMRLGTRVTDVTHQGVQVQTGSGEEFLPLRNVFWAAGVMASPWPAPSARPWIGRDAWWSSRACRFRGTPRSSSPGTWPGTLGGHGTTRPRRGAGRHPDGSPRRPDHRPGSLGAAAGQPSALHFSRQGVRRGHREGPGIARGEQQKSARPCGSSNRSARRAGICCSALADSPDRRGRSR